jgi:divalent metal cation (Fe/Co/Zn/Cd) transporter
MAYYTTLIALSWNEGNYQVNCKIETDINLQLLKNDGLLHNASASSNYMDNAAIVSKNDFPKYFNVNEDNKKTQAEKWYRKLDHSVAFIIVHEAEWESGFSD